MKRSRNINKRVKSQFFIIVAFLISLFIILLIYDSNRQTLEAKITNATFSSDRSEPNPSNSAAQETMESIQQLMRDVKSNPNDYNLLVQAGNAFFDIGRYEQAITYYKKANHINSVTEILIDQGVCYFNLGLLDSALMVMKEGISRDPNHKQGLYNIGIVLYNLGDVEGAIANWEKLILSYPNTTEAIRVQQYIDEIKNTQIGS